MGGLAYFSQSGDPGGWVVSPPPATGGRVVGGWVGGGFVGGWVGGQRKTNFGGELTHQRRRRKIAVLWRLGGDFPSFWENFRLK